MTVRSQRNSEFKQRKQWIVIQYAKDNVKTSMKLKTLIRAKYELERKKGWFNVKLVLNLNHEQQR